MPAEHPNRFYVTHPTRGNLLWRVGGTPHYFKSADAAQTALDSFIRDTRTEGYAAGYYVAEYGLTPAERHYEARCQTLRHAR